MTITDAEVEAAAKAAFRVFVSESGERWNDLAPYELKNWLDLGKAALEAASKVRGEIDLDRLRARLNDFTDSKTPGMVSVGLLNVERETNDRLRAELEETTRGAKDAQGIAEHWTREAARLRAAIENCSGSCHAIIHAEGPNAAPER